MDVSEIDPGKAGVLSRHPWVPRRKLEVRDYHRMGEAGVFHPDERVELIEGELVPMAPVGSTHSGTVNATTHALVRAVGDTAVVSVQNPVRLGDDSEPEPDFMLLVPRPDYYRARTAIATHILLLIEVADASLRFDHAVKLPLYARHGIPEVWIVDLVANTVETFARPEGETYRATGVAGREDTLRPTRLPEVAIPVAAILG